MFLNFYGLSEQPFGVTPDPEYLYLSATHREALASVAYGIQAGVGFAAIIAKPGMGKTTLLFSLLRHFRNSTQSAFLFDTQCNSKELLQSLLAEFKIQEESGNSEASTMVRLRQFLLKSARANQRVLVMVDEAQNLDIPVFETLRLLSNFETPHAKLLHIVLVGQPELGRKLARPELEQLRQRITIVARLDTLAPADVVSYVAHRLKRAGYRGGPLFTPEALGMLMAKCHGVPREINRLCFNALSLGCALGKRVIDDTILGEAAADLEFGSLLNQEEAAHGHECSETPDVLAALFSTALQAPTPPKEETDIPGQKLHKSASAVAPKSEQRVSEQPKAGREEKAGTAKSSTVSASPSDALGTAVAPQGGSGTASGKAGQQELLNLWPKPAAMSSRSRQSQRSPFRYFAWWLSLTVVAATLFGTLVRSGNFHKVTTLAYRLVPVANVNAATTNRSLPAPEIPVAPDITTSVSSAATAGAERLGQKDAQTMWLRNETAVPTGNYVPARQISASLAGAPAFSRSAVGTTAAQPPRQQIPMVDKASNPAAPETMMMAKLIKRVDPIYPQSARSSGISGEVVLSARINDAGKVQEVRAISGDPTLASAAMDAVQQWEYRPSLVDGHPRPSNTRIVITFSLR